MLLVCAWRGRAAGTGGGSMVAGAVLRERCRLPWRGGAEAYGDRAPPPSVRRRLPAGKRWQTNCGGVIAAEG